MEELVLNLKAGLWHLTIRNEEAFEQEVLLTLERQPVGKQIRFFINWKILVTLSLVFEGSWCELGTYAAFPLTFVFFVFNLILHMWFGEVVIRVFRLLLMVI
jgi:hypothetical protein